MNIAVINIKDLAKYFLIVMLVFIVVIAGIIIIEPVNIIEKTKKSSFIQCLEMSLPIMTNEQTEKQQTKESSSAKILDTQLAMMNNGDKTEEEKETQEETKQNVEEEPKQEEIKEPENKTIAETENKKTEVIEENNIKATYNYDEVGVQVKNQSKYDVKELIQNANYQIKNKQKVVIYHTHTCESYTTSEKYPYEMTGAYRTTDLNYTVAKVRRRTRRMPKTIWKNSNTRQNIS